jgi:hypothetical protein
MLLPKLIWSVTPSGVDRRGYRLTISVSPRHDVPGTNLSDYAPANWPSAVLHMAKAKKFWLALDDPGAPLLATTIDTSQLRPELWPIVFPPTTRITSFVFNRRSVHQSACCSVEALEAYLGALPESELTRDLRVALPEIRAALERSRPPPASAKPTDFDRALRFYDLPGPRAPRVFGFHQALALLGRHRFLMRALGLVFDCTLTFGELGGRLPEVGRLRAQLSWGPPHPSPCDHTPWSRFRADRAGFHEHPADGLSRQRASRATRV